MKITMTDGTVFEGTMVEYAELLAWVERKTAEEAAVKVESKPKPFAEGDIVVITANTNDSCNAVGDIGKISEYVVDKDSHRVLVPRNGNLGNWTLESEMRHAAAEEIAQYEKAVADASKPNLKAGDFVKFTKRGDYNSADITLNKPYLVFEDSYGDLSFKDDAEDYREEPLAETDCYEILSEDEVASEKWAEIGRDPGEFKLGDIVRVNSGLTGGHPTGTIGELVSGEGFAIRREFGVLSNGETRDHTASGFVLIAPVDARFDK